MKKILMFLILSLVIFGKEIPQEQLKKVGELIFKNEAGGKKEGLIAWNIGEEFPSLGIGHFIWYPKNYNGVFQESFPTLQEYLVKRGYILPKLLNVMDAPWNTRDEFIKSKGTKDYADALNFLENTKEIQVELIAIRAEKALEIMLKHTKRPKEIKKVFYEVYNSPFGIYPIIDYVNFKGEGIKESERYKDEGWGLLQVLEYMAEDKSKLSPVTKFINGAKFVLNRRVENSPVERNEKKWLQGWLNRVDSYKISK